MGERQDDIEEIIQYMAKLPEQQRFKLSMNRLIGIPPETGKK
jgi:hypothetical protein